MIDTPITAPAAPGITEPAAGAVPACSAARQILATAGRLFAERGYEGTSVHDIASAAGVSKAAVFHHFASKQALYLAALRDAAVQTAAEIESLVTTPGRDGRKLGALMELILAKMLQNPQHTRLVFRELLEHGTERGRALAQQVFERNFSAEVALFEQGRRSGAFRQDVDPVIGWLTMIAANVTFFLCRDVLRHNPAFEYADRPQEFVNAVCDLLLHGLVPADAAPANSAAGRP